MVMLGASLTISLVSCSLVDVEYHEVCPILLPPPPAHIFGIKNNNINNRNWKDKGFEQIALLCVNNIAPETLFSENTFNWQKREGIDHKYVFDVVIKSTLTTGTSVLSLWEANSLKALQCKPDLQRYYMSTMFPSLYWVIPQLTGLGCPRSPWLAVNWQAGWNVV